MQVNIFLLYYNKNMLTFLFAWGMIRAENSLEVETWNRKSFPGG